MKMLFVSKDNKRFIATDSGSPCFLTGSHIQLAKREGLDLSGMDNLTMAFSKNGKGSSIKDFLNK